MSTRPTTPTSIDSARSSRLDRCPKQPPPLGGLSAGEQKDRTGIRRHDLAETGNHPRIHLDRLGQHDAVYRLGAGPRGEGPRVATWPGCETKPRPRPIRSAVRPIADLSVRWRSGRSGSTRASLPSLAPQRDWKTVGPAGPVLTATGETGGVRAAARLGRGRFSHSRSVSSPAVRATSGAYLPGCKLWHSP
jgi:hypothetical protein